MVISDRAARVSPSPTLAITAKARQLQAQGVDVISFGAGEPDFDTPDHIKQAAIQALQDGFTKYTPSSGINELKAAVAAYLKRNNALEYRPEEIVVSCGAKHALYNAFLTICNPGDEVIIARPYWVSYPEQVRLAEGVPVAVGTAVESGFALTAAAVAEKITARTRAVVVNSPNNPTGAVYPPAEMDAIARLAVEHDFYIVSDEIYDQLIYTGDRPLSVATLGPEAHARTITINGVSKTYAMTGWRIGFAAAPAALAKAMGQLQDHSTSNPTSIAQKAALAALTGPQEEVRQMVEQFARRRLRLVDGLNAIPGVECPTPGGAFYVFPRVSGLFSKRWQKKPIASSDSLADFLLTEAQVAVVPGSGFGADDCIRLSYATSMENIERGVERIARAIHRLEA